MISKYTKEVLAVVALNVLTLPVKAEMNLARSRMGC